jgi:2-polyprenyl-3-methyl-5-hydroxy-6-metoxy-1,4-benzoquinol methylase
MSVFNEPIRESQMYVRRAAHLLHKRGVVTVGPNHKAPRLGGEASEKFFENGKRQVAKLEREIEGFTGCTLDGRRALDFGCGVGRLALPLAERCEYVYGLDISSGALKGADARAKRLNLTNVEWLDADRVAELSGQYDYVQSLLVFQHIPSREGERIFDTLVRGLRPDGVGAIQLTLRPPHPLAGFLHSKSKSSLAATNPMRLVRGWDWSYPYMLIHSYSLNRICQLLANAGALQSHVRWHPPSGAHDVVTIIFHKAIHRKKGQAEGQAPNGAAVIKAPPAGDAAPQDSGSESLPAPGDQQI